MEIKVFYNGKFCRDLGEKRIHSNGCACSYKNGIKRRFRGFTIKIFKHGIRFDFNRCKDCKAPF